MPGVSKEGGIRLGTTCIAQLGFTEQDASALAQIIADILKGRHDNDTDAAKRVRQLVETAVR